MESKSFIRKIISNPIIQTLAVYVSGGWILIELLEYFIAHFNLNEQFRNIFLIVLLSGLPVAMIIAWLVSRDKKPGDEKITVEYAKETGSVARILRKSAITIPGLVIITVALVFGIRYLNQSAKIKWAREQALPEIKRLRAVPNDFAAFDLMKEAEKYISDEPEFQELKSNVIDKLTILTDPPGAEIYFRDYENPDRGWENIGITPIDSLELPRLSFFQVRIEKPGYEEVMAIASTRQDTFYRKLFPEGAGMKPQLMPSLLVRIFQLWNIGAQELDYPISIYRIT